MESTWGVCWTRIPHLTRLMETVRPLIIRVLSLFLIGPSKDSMSNRSQFLRSMYPALRPSPDVPRSPGYTMSSIPTSPTSYGSEPPSRTYMGDGTVARILEKADQARAVWPSSPATKSIPIAFGFQWHDGSSGDQVSCWRRLCPLTCG